MKPNKKESMETILGVTFIMLAASLYTISIWSEKIIRQLKKWILLTFATAFSCDLVGTSMMFCLSEHKLYLTMHSVGGYLALVVMGLHLFWAFKSYKHPEKNFAKLFAKFSPFAWILWIVVFISGIPKM